MPTAKKLPSGSWRCLAYSHTEKVWDEKNEVWKDKRIYESFTSDDPTKNGKKEAEYAAAEWKLRHKERGAESISVYDAITKYIKLKEGVLSPSTSRSYTGMQKNYFTGSLGGIKLNDLTNTDIQLWISEIAHDLSPKTVRNAHALLSSTLEMFLPDFRLKTTLPAKKKPELYTPSDKDVKKLLEHIKGKELELAVLLAAFGPLRRGEICALTSDDIKGNVVTVSKSMVKGPDELWHIKQPKTYSGYREVEFPDFVIKKIKGIEGRIIKATPAQISNRFDRAIRYSGLPHFRFHDLRHYSASIMHAIGVPDQYILQRGGWGSDNVMKSVYRNVIDMESTKQNKKIIKHFEKVSY
ncbi:MAG: site-specific integrase [Lachnospiraceae bacterium]